MAQKEAVFDLLQSRIISHYPQAKMIRDGEMPAPRMAIVYPTYVCNQDCVWCEYSADNAEHHNIMPKDKFRQLVVDLERLGVQGIEFCGGGEPTLHPIFTEVVRDTHNRGIKVGLLTNGTKLYGDLADALVDCASYVRVGFDGGTEETVHKVKRPRSPEARFDAVCRNIQNMIALRNERGTGCLISMKIVVSQDNCHEIEECVKLAIELGIDSVQFKAARLCDTEISPEQGAEVDSEIARCREAYPNATVIGSMQKVNAATRCWLTPLQLVVDSLGDVFLCCYYRHRKDAHTIGNAFNESLNEIWHRQEHWDKIDGIEPKQCNNLDCRFVKYNQIMDALMVENDAQLEFI